MSLSRSYCVALNAGRTRLPLLQWVLITITAIYLARGLAIVPVLVFARSRFTPFLLWSSLVCVVYGAVHLLGLRQVWSLL